MIPFNQALKSEIDFTEIDLDKKDYIAKCEQWFQNHLGKDSKPFLVPSCTAALEMAALLMNLQEGDEVIMPSYTFVSTANAFALRGAKIVFVDVDPRTMNLNCDLIEKALSEKTKAVVLVHYGGVACDMDKVMRLAKQHSFYVVEDAAQAMMATYQGKKLGTIGHFGTYSFHSTKNYTSGGEGGLLIVNDPEFSRRAEIIREKGTNRLQFFRGQVDKYSWVDIGSSYLLSEIQAAYLYPQLQEANVINEKRLAIWWTYYDALKPLADERLFDLVELASGDKHNGHLFYMELSNLKERTKFIAYLKGKGIMAMFHYVPLHSSEAGKRLGKFKGRDLFTTQGSESLVRLPLFYDLKMEQVEKVIEAVKGYFDR